MDEIFDEEVDDALVAVAGVSLALTLTLALALVLVSWLCHLG